MGVAVRLPAWLNDASVSYPAENDRLTLSGLLASSGSALGYRSGVLPSAASALQVAPQGTPNMTVAVSPGQAAVAGSLTATQGAYVITADSSVTLTIASADPTNPRYDIVVLTVEDKQYAGTNNDAILQVITGTPNATPAVPTTPANSLILAQIHVGAAVTSIGAADITDKRVYTTARGGVLPCTSATHPSTPYNGLEIFETDTGKKLVWDGTAWQPIPTDAVPGNFVRAPARAGKRVHWGSASATTDASGYATITHGAGFSPTVVLANLGVTGGVGGPIVGTDSYGATTFRVRVSNTTTATSISVAYACFE